MNNELIAQDVLKSVPLDISQIDYTVNDGDCGCYAIYCKHTEMYYIGSSLNCKKRRYDHFYWIKNKSARTKKLYEDILKYGESGFVFFMIEHCIPSELETLEQKWCSIVGHEKLYNSRRKVVRTNKQTCEMDSTIRTVKMWADMSGKNPDSVRKKATRLLGGSYGITSVLTDSQFFQMYPDAHNAHNTEIPDVSGHKASVPDRFVSEPQMSAPDRKSPDIENTDKIPFHIFALEAGYYVTVVTACYGFSLAMPGVIGYSFAVVYGLLSFAALQMVKDSSIPKTAEYGRNMVYVLEVIAAVFAHYYTINRALWANLKALPFEVAYLPKGGMWEVDYAGNGVNGYWQNGEVVFNLACILSVILASLAVAAISLRLELTKERGGQNA